MLARAQTWAAPGATQNPEPEALGPALRDYPEEERLGWG